jgi:ribosomal protein S27AE
MTKISNEMIIAALKERGVTAPCPRCGNLNFAIVDGFFNQPLQQDFNALVIGGRSLPTVVTACSRCGFLAQHALGALGFLPEKQPPTSPENDTTKAKT